MAKTIIPAGYRVSITSWENDADNYNTVILEGQTEDEVKFLVELCKLHYSQHGWRHSDIKSFGNMYEPSDEEIDEHREAIKKLLEEFPNSGMENVDWVIDALYDLGLSGGEFYTRVFDSIKIEYIPTEIVLEDVTDKFMKE